MKNLSVDSNSIGLITILTKFQYLDPIMNEKLGFFVTGTRKDRV